MEVSDEICDAMGRAENEIAEVLDKHFSPDDAGSRLGALVFALASELESTECLACRAQCLERAVSILTEEVGKAASVH